MSPSVAIHVGPAAIAFYAQEATLCQIPIFRVALQGRFQEAHEKKIKLLAENPVIFTALLEHIHTGSYTYMYKPEANVIDDIPVPDLAEGYFHASVYKVVITYEWQPLVDDAVANFIFALSKLVAMDVIRLWKAAYENGLTLPVCERDGRLVHFKKTLPGLLQGLYKSNAEEMAETVSQCPELVNDLMHLLVARHAE